MMSQEIRDFVLRVELVVSAQYNFAEEPENAVYHLLADIRHYCDAKDLAFHEIDKRAYRMYREDRHAATIGTLHWDCKICGREYDDATEDEIARWTADKYCCDHCREDNACEVCDGLLDGQDQCPTCKLHPI